MFLPSNWGVSGNACKVTHVGSIGGGKPPPVLPGGGGGPLDGAVGAPGADLGGWGGWRETGAAPP